MFADSNRKKNFSKKLNLVLDKILNSGILDLEESQIFTKFIAGRKPMQNVDTIYYRILERLNLKFKHYILVNHEHEAHTLVKLMDNYTEDDIASIIRQINNDNYWSTKIHNIIELNRVHRKFTPIKPKPQPVPQSDMFDTTEDDYENLRYN